MVRPSNFMTAQTVTVFTPHKANVPVNGGYPTSYTKGIFENVRCVCTEDKSLRITIFDVDSVIDYRALFENAIIVLGIYALDEPPKEGSDTHFYKVQSVSYRVAGNNQLHNIGVVCV